MSPNEFDDLTIHVEADFLAAVVSSPAIPVMVCDYLAELLAQLCQELAHEAEIVEESKAIRFFQECAQNTHDPDMVRQAWHALRTITIPPEAFHLLRYSLLILAGDQREVVARLWHERQPQAS